MLPKTLTTRPEALFLDAGDTLLFLDCGAVSAALATLGEQVDTRKLEASVLASKRAYQATLERGGNHEDGWSVLMRALLTLSDVSEPRARELLPSLRAIHDEFYFWRNVPAGLSEALSKARAAGLRLGVISNSEGKIAQMIARVGLGDHFEIVVDSHIEGVSKPNPEIWRRALSRMNVRAERSLYAGDIPEVDVDGANGAGLFGVCVDAFDHYVDRASLPRVRSVMQLVDELLALPR